MPSLFISSPSLISGMVLVLVSKVFAPGSEGWKIDCSDANGIFSSFLNDCIPFNPFHPMIR